MADAEEIQYDNDCLVISINIVDCPMAEIPLTEVFDVPTKSLVDNYHNVIRGSVWQQLGHTTRPPGGGRPSAFRMWMRLQKWECAAATRLLSCG
jgi:hypothetical protein